MQYLQLVWYSCRSGLTSGVFPKCILFYVTMFLFYRNEGVYLCLGNGREKELRVGGSQYWKMFADPKLKLNLKRFWVAIVLHRLNKEF